MIEFKTQLDINAQKALNKFMLKKLLVVFGIFSLVLIIIGGLGIVMSEDSSDYSAGITLIAVGLLFTPLLLLINSIGQKSLTKSAPYLNKQTKEIYRFSQDGFEHLQKRDESFYSHTKADYTYFYKIISTSTHYFMYVSDRQCHIIDKSHITQGSCEELDEILIKKFPVGKFKKIKR